MLVVFLFVMKPIFPVFQYVLNYDYIAKELCENKAKPEMHCNGKCHLMKELAKASENETPITSDKKVSHHESEVLFFEQLVTFDFFQKNVSSQKELNTRYVNFYKKEDLTSVFHPPSFMI